LCVECNYGYALTVGSKGQSVKCEWQSKTNLVIAFGSFIVSILFCYGGYSMCSTYCCYEKPSSKQFMEKYGVPDSSEKVDLQMADRRLSVAVPIDDEDEAEQKYAE